MSEAEEWLHRPKQERSKATTDRLLEACQGLLRERDLDQVSVAEIAARAGISVGGFYARFKNKEALLHALDKHLLAVMRRRVRLVLRPQRLEGFGVAEVAGVYIRAMLRFFADNRQLVRQVALKARASDDPTYTARLRAFNQEAHALLADRLRERGAAARHADPDAALGFAVMMVSATAREAVLFGSERLNLSSLRGRQLAEELIRAFVAYLGATGAQLDPPRS